MLNPLSQLPVLIFWCPNDCVVPFSNSEKVLESFSGKKKLVQLTIKKKDAQPWFTHTPENDPENFEEFHKEIIDFIH